MYVVIAKERRDISKRGKKEIFQYQGVTWVFRR